MCPEAAWNEAAIQSTLRRRITFGSSPVDFFVRRSRCLRICELQLLQSPDYHNPNVRRLGAQLQSPDRKTHQMSMHQQRGAAANYEHAGFDRRDISSSRLAMNRYRRIGDQIDILGESPIWHEREGALYWVDVRRPAIRRLDHANGNVVTWNMPGLIGSIAFAENGRLLAALADQIALFEPATGKLEAVASLPARIPDHRFNDGRCDRQGRFWVGTMHNVTRAPEGVLYRLDPERGELLTAKTGICIPNSLAWSPDGRTMYFADSLRYAIFAYDFDTASGQMSNERTFVETRAPGFPDGSTVDADGYLWNAEFNAWRVVRYAPDGRIDRVIELPAERPTSCAFGGPNFDVLYVTTASQWMSESEMAAQPMAGALLAIETDVRGLPEPRLATKTAIQKHS
jgi:sugar lactone lactonase YvrE